MRKQNKTAQFVIDGLEVTVTKNNIHIKDSWQVRKRKDIKSFLQKLEHEIGFGFESPFDHMSINRMTREWITHNNLYRLGLWRDRTGSVDLNYPQRWYMPILYFIFSVIVL